MTGISFDPLAEPDLADAISYYDEISPKLGDALLEETVRVAEQLLEFPMSVPIWQGQLRRRPLFRFPYSFVYLFDQDLIYVVAVLHQARGPTHVARRVSNYLKNR